jgi:hypothetical protein
MSDKKQSSVEWFAERIKSDRIFSFEKVLEQAKTMHKEEMGKTWDSALDAGQERAWNIMRAYADFDDYYNETFNK